MKEIIRNPMNSPLVLQRIRPFSITIPAGKLAGTWVIGFPLAWDDGVIDDAGAAMREYLLLWNGSPTMRLGSPRELDPLQTAPPVPYIFVTVPAATKEDATVTLQDDEFGIVIPPAQMGIWKRQWDGSNAQRESKVRHQAQQLQWIVRRLSDLTFVYRQGICEENYPPYFALVNFSSDLVELAKTTASPRRK